MRTAYTSTFAQLQPRHDPRHIEAFVRLQFGTLSHLRLADLRHEARIAAACIVDGGRDGAESLAQSFAL